jgi:uncharacterized protein YqjF (DUF2071 family)
MLRLEPLKSSANMNRNEPPRRDVLTATWANLSVITYAVDEERLRAVLPPGCVPDLRDGRAFASLVAFDFLGTRVMGISWPGHRNFPEINLRFYVRHGERRGVCFLREFVPRRVVATMARLLYNEPYRAATMSSHTNETPDTIEVNQSNSRHWQQARCSTGRRQRGAFFQRAFVGIWDEPARSALKLSGRSSHLGHLAREVV